MATKATYRPPQTSIEVFTQTDQQAVIREMRQRLDDLETVTGSGSSRSSSRIAPTPPRAQLSVVADPTVAPGVFNVMITNPEDVPSNPPKNTAKTPIFHILQSSPNPNFSGNVTSFPPSTQNHYSVTQFGPGARHFQVISSYDKKNYNQPVPIGPFTS
jgi:hypothetical protein